MPDAPELPEPSFEGTDERAFLVLWLGLGPWDRRRFRTYKGMRWGHQSAWLFRAPARPAEPEWAEPW